MGNALVYAALMIPLTVGVPRVNEGTVEGRYEGEYRGLDVFVTSDSTGNEIKIWGKEDNGWANCLEARDINRDGRFDFIDLRGCKKGSELEKYATLNSAKKIFKYIVKHGERK